MTFFNLLHSGGGGVRSAKQLRGSVGAHTIAELLLSLLQPFVFLQGNCLVENKLLRRTIWIHTVVAQTLKLERLAYTPAGQSHITHSVREKKEGILK